MWVFQIGFKEYALQFEEVKVDGDLLLQMNEEDLIDSINMHPGIVRRRYAHTLNNVVKYIAYMHCLIDIDLLCILKLR